MKIKVDLFIVGGGPAGLAAALAARKKGLQVIVADGARFPIEKACGEGLMPGTVHLLRELGVKFQNGDGCEFLGIRFIDGDRRAQANFPGATGVGMPRRTLHERLVAAAEKSGATLLWNSPVTELRPNGVYLGAKFFPSRWIIGADGAQSRVARWAGLHPRSRLDLRFARQQHFAVKPWSEYVEVYWGKESQAYVTPIKEDETCLAMLSRDPHSRMETLIAHHPELHARLSGATPSSIERGAVTGTHRLPRVTKGNILLTGDASGTVDAITGEGMRLGFEHAIAAVDSIVSGNLSGYESKHRQIARRPGNMAAVLQMLDAKPRLRERVLHALVAAPSLFEKLLALHVGEGTFLQTVSAGAGLGWRLLFAQPR